MTYFLLPDLVYDRKELVEYALSYNDWMYYGRGRFSIYIGLPKRELIIPIATKFKNPKELFKKIELNLVKANGIVFPHTDNDRNLTMNLPLLGDFKNSTLDLYKAPTDSGIASSDLQGPGAQDDDLKKSGKLYPHAELVDQVPYEVPVCFDTQEIHRVTNATNEDRYILSLSFKQEFTYEKIKDMYEYGELLV